MRSLGDWLARDVITVAKVTEGDKTLEDLGIMGIEPGQHIVKCADVEPLQDALSAELRKLWVGMDDARMHDSFGYNASVLISFMRSHKDLLKEENRRLRDQLEMTCMDAEFERKRVREKIDNLKGLACDMLRCIHANGCDGCEWFKDDECSLHLAERYEKFGIEVG